MVGVRAVVLIGVVAVGLVHQKVEHLRSGNASEDLPSMALVSGCIVSHQGYDPRLIKAGYSSKTCSESLENKREFCSCQAWKCLLHNSSSLSESNVNLKWNKVLWLRQAFALGVDWVVWVDGDTVLMDLNSKKLQQVAASAHPDDLVIVGSDRNGINTGAFMMRTGAESEKYLDSMWSTRHVLKIAGGWPHDDQNAFQEVMSQKDNSKHLSKVKLQTLQGYPFVIYGNDRGKSKAEALRYTKNTVEQWSTGVPIAHNVDCHVYCNDKMVKLLGDVVKCGASPKTSLVMSRGQQEVPPLMQGEVLLQMDFMGRQTLPLDDFTYALLKDDGKDC